MHEFHLWLHRFVVASKEAEKEREGLLVSIMNDIYGKRLARTMMFQQLLRTHGTLWAATQVTKEPLNYKFVEEELMRVNGKRAMPLLIGASAQQDLHNTHWNHLSDNFSWTESARAYAVRHQTPFTQHVAAVGRMAENINHARSASTCQLLVNEHMARIEGIAGFEEEPSLGDESD